jgi:hypothetical protein
MNVKKKPEGAGMKIILCFLKSENTLLKPVDTFPEPDYRRLKPNYTYLLPDDSRPMPAYTNLLSVYTNLLSGDSRLTSIDSRPMPGYIHLLPGDSRPESNSIHPGFANNRGDTGFTADDSFSAFL